MRTSVSLLLCFVLFVSINQIAFGQTTYSWTGGSGLWSVSTNWSPNGVPASIDNVVISADGTYDVTLDTDATVAGIEIGGTNGTQRLVLSGRTLTINGDLNINANGGVALSASSTINGTGTINNSGAFTAFTSVIDMDFVNDAYIAFTNICSVNGSLTTTTDSRININCTTTANEITLANGFTNHGLIYFTNSGTTSLGTINITSGTLINAPDGTIESTSITLYPTFGNKIFAPLDNQGELIISQGFYIDKEDAAHTNSGTIHVQEGGTLYLTQTGSDPSFTSSGSLAVDTLAALSVTGGDFSHTPGTFSLVGTFSAKNSAVITFSDPIVSQNVIDIQYSTLHCESTFINRSNFNLLYSTMTCAGDIDNQNSMNIRNSTVSSDGTLTNSGTLTVFTGIIDMDLVNDDYIAFTNICSVNGSLTTTADSRININCTTTYNEITIANGFTNHGLIYYTNSGTTSLGTIDMGNDTLLNAPDGTIESNSIPLYPTFTNKLYATLINEGQISTSQGYLILNSGATHINRGTITVNSDILAIKGSPFINEATGTIMGKGTLDISSVSFTNAGTISPGLSPGTLNVTGTQYQTENSMINIEIGGKVVDSEYDQLKHTGNVALDGHLNIALIDDFIPDLGDVFDVMTHASSSGEFSRFSGRSTGKGFSFDVEQAAAYVRLTAVEPYNILPYVENMIGDFELNEDFDHLVVANLDTIFQDEDLPFGDSLIYSVSLSENLLEASVTDNILSLSALPDANGTLSVIVFAKDTSNFGISDTFNVTILPENDLPLEFSLSEPSDNQTLTSLDNIEFKWNSSYDIDEDPLLYELKIMGTAWDTIIQDISDTSLVYIPNSSLRSSSEYEWTVSVSDGHGVVLSLDTFSFTTPFISSVDDPIVSEGFELKQNYPNPFSQNTTIEFTIPKSDHVSLKIYDVAGHLVDILVEEVLQAGSHSYRLDAGNLGGGLYLYRLETGELAQVKRMTLME